MITSTTVQYNPNDPRPEAYIAINKNRAKVYYSNNNSKGSIYLKDKQTFQIELYNPTRNDILGVISINNVKIDGGGIILRPGERVFLERYLTENRKFVFSTYVASGNTKELAFALQDNGVIKVEFHKEVILPQYNTVFYNQNYKSPNTHNLRRRSCKGASRGISQSMDSYDYNTTYGSSTLGMDNLKLFSDTNIGCFNMSSKIKEVETGKIEKGEASSQSMVFIDKDFETNSFASVEYQLLPLSQQQLSVNDINKVRRYCDSCGVKIAKQNAKYCWNCGELL
jgi:hypothetical protein